MIGADTETGLIKVGEKVPPLACLSLFADGKGVLLYHTDVDLDVVKWVLDQDSVWHNASYDMAVLARHVPEAFPLIFEAYFEERVHCTLHREKLIDLAHGQLELKKKGAYSLETLAKKRLERILDKDTYRLMYGELRDLPLSEWPQGAIDYPIEDAKTALDLCEAQHAFPTTTDDLHLLADAPRQAAYDFAFTLLSAWGMRTDARRVARLKTDTLAELKRMQDELVARGLMKVTPSGTYTGKVTRDLKAIRAAVMDAYGDAVPTTGKGNISTSRDTMEAHPKLKIISDYVALEKLNSTYIKVLEEGIHAPIHGRFHLLATGRRGADKNMQTLPKYGPVRSCYRPRAGFVFGAVDFDSLEMRTWSQVMVNLFGIDNVPMAQLYQRDPAADPHTKFAAEYFMRGTYDEGMALKHSAEQAKLEGRALTREEKELKQFRQAAKAYNFGLPGGLGVDRFVAMAFKDYGVEVTPQEARTNIKAWKDLWNAWQYFAYVAHMDENYGWVEQFGSERIRGGLGYCDLANTLFQGLAADGCMLALFLCAWACYAQPESDMYGSRPVNSLHDEIVFEFPREKASKAIHEAIRTMVGAMSYYCPDVPIRASGALMTRWLKDAPCIMKNGEMQVYEVP
jgi:DNA polymerase-1